MFCHLLTMQYVKRVCTWRGLVQVTGQVTGHRPQARSQVRPQATGQVTGQITGHTQKQ